LDEVAICQVNERVASMSRRSRRKDTASLSGRRGRAACVWL